MTSQAYYRMLFSLKPSSGSATPAYGVLALAQHLIKKSLSGPALKLEFSASQEKDVMVAVDDSQTLSGNSHQILRFLGSQYPASKVYGDHPTIASQIDYWIDFAQDQLYSSDFKKLSANFDVLNHHLTLRSFMVGYHLTLADFAVWGALKSNAVFNRQLKTGKYQGEFLTRWYSYIGSLEEVQAALQSLESAKDANKDRRDQGSMEIPLPDAIPGKVVTRFPPEPSGYLHIGHAKAALLNDYFARSYNGKLIIRFDDTNPSKEKMEYEDSIKADLLLLGIKGDQITHTSDYFDHLYSEALRIIKMGKAYVDDTDQETMRAERFDGIESKNRNLSVEENLRRFEEMKNGTEFGLKCCLRAKIDMQDKNKAMRDPVIYRCNLTPHHFTGDKWKIYPTYDFACPIVDSLEGVTHALRTIEYRDRNAQYAWFLKTLNIRWVHVWDYSRLNFVYTLLSKRKLTWFVDEKYVTGWDDPRFPTVRGIRRRGLTIEALRQYIISQGASQRDLMLEWDKLWATNKKVIDPVSPRHTALAKSDLVPVKVIGSSVETHTKSLPKHKKNPAVGEKLTTFATTLLLEQEDARSLEVGEEITLMDWGNVFVRSVQKNADGSAVNSVEIELHLEGDFKKTKKKLTWLADTKGDVTREPIPVTLFDYDYLITKKKLEEEDDVKDFITPVTEFKTEAIGDANLRALKKGDIIQLERKGYYICDKAFDEAQPTSPVHLIYIPDGKVSSLASKASTEGKEAASPAAGSPARKSAKKAKDAAPSSGPAPASKMYPIKSMYGDLATPSADKISKMYEVKSFYPEDQVSAPVAKPGGRPSKKEKAALAAAQTPASGTESAAAPEKGGRRPKQTLVKDESSIISKLDIVVGKIVHVKKHPDADSLYVEQIDVGEETPREVVSGLVKFMQPEELQDRLVLVLKNLKPVSMRGIKSFAMVLCASDSTHEKVEFLIPPEGSVPGDKVFFKGHEGEPEAQLNPKKKVWETVQPDFSTTDDLVAVWKGVPFETSKGVVKTKSIPKASIK